MRELHGRAAFADEHLQRLALRGAREVGEARTIRRPSGNRYVVAKSHDLQSSASHVDDGELVVVCIVRPILSDDDERDVPPVRRDRRLFEIDDAGHVVEAQRRGRRGAVTGRSDGE